MPKIYKVFILYFCSEMKINFEILLVFSMLFSCMTPVKWDMFRRIFGDFFP